MWKYCYSKSPNELYHYGVKGMRWGHRKVYEPVGRKPASNFDSEKLKENVIRRVREPVGRKLARNFDSEKLKEETIRRAYAVGADLNPREMKYSVRRKFNSVNDTTQLVSDSAVSMMRSSGTLTSNPKALRAIESTGINTHKKAVYNNLNDNDLSRLKTYTDSARYSRSVNGYLATGEPKGYKNEADNLKRVLGKNQLNNVTVYRSCNLKFSTDGIGKKLNTLGEKEMQAEFDSMSRNFKGKSRKENRVWSTSTSPLFAIDTWRKVNPTAAKTYNTYMIINCKNCNGLLADGRTSSGQKLVHTRSNQEAILAPDKLVYRDMKFDKERGMFAITVDAISEPKENVNG